MSCDREDCACLFTPGECACPCNACAAENLGTTKPLPIAKPAFLGRPSFCGGVYFIAGAKVFCNATAPAGQTRCAKCKANEERRRQERVQAFQTDTRPKKVRRA